MIINFEDAIEVVEPLVMQRNVESRTRTYMTPTYYHSPTTSKNQSAFKRRRGAFVNPHKILIGLGDIMPSNKKRSVVSQTAAEPPAKKICVSCDTEATEELIGIDMTMSQIYQPFFTAVKERSFVISLCKNNCSTIGKLQYDFSVEEEILDRLQKKRQMTSKQETPAKNSASPVSHASLEINDLGQENDQNKV